MLFFLSFYSNGCIAVFISACTNVIQRRGDKKKKLKKALLFGQSKSLLHPRGPGGHKQSVMTSDLEHLPGFSPGIPVWYLPARAVAETLHG